MNTTPERFELPRAKPNRFLIDRLNHSAKVPVVGRARRRSRARRGASTRSKNKNNADSRDRTSDLQIFSLTLSQLSYTGVLHRTPGNASWGLAGRLRIAVSGPAGPSAPGVPVAKWTRRRFPEPKIVGSNPIWDVLFGRTLFFFHKIIFYFHKF